MNDVSRAADSSAFSSYSQSTTTTGAPTQPSQIKIDTAQTVAVMQSLASTMQATQMGGNGDSISNGNGAPQIDGISLSFSPEDMAAALATLQSKTQQQQINSAQKGIETNKNKVDQQNQRQMGKIQDWIKKCQEASAKQKASGILGWFKRIFTAVAAVFAVVVAAVVTTVSAGAGAALLALATLALLHAALDIAGAAGAKGDTFEKALKFSDLGTAIGTGIGEAAKKLGANERDVGIVCTVFTTAVTMAVAVGTAVATGGLSISSSVAKVAMSASRLGEAVTGVLNGATGAASGGLEIAAGADIRDADNIQADRKEIAAVIAKLQKQMEEEGDDLKKVLNEMMNGMSIVSQMINAAGESRAQLAANLSASKSMA
jgi:hypothetical protein